MSGCQADGWTERNWALQLGRLDPAADLGRRREWGIMDCFRAVRMENAEKWPSANVYAELGIGGGGGFQAYVMISYNKWVL